jgi:hypothetical protein
MFLPKTHTKPSTEKTRYSKLGRNNDYCENQEQEAHAPKKTSAAFENKQTNRSEGFPTGTFKTFKRRNLVRAFYTLV